MVADYCWSIKRDLKKTFNETDNRDSENSYHVYESFISAVSLFNDLIKILVGICIFNRVISKDLGFDC